MFSIFKNYFKEEAALDKDLILNLRIIYLYIEKRIFRKYQWAFLAPAGVKGVILDEQTMLCPHMLII